MGEEVYAKQFEDGGEGKLNEYQLKLAILKEYEEILGLKKTYYEALEICSGTLRELVTYYEHLGLPIPDRIQKLMFSLVETDENLQDNLPTRGRQNREMKRFHLPRDDDTESVFCDSPLT